MAWWKWQDDFRVQITDADLNRLEAEAAKINCSIKERLMPCERDIDFEVLPAKNAKEFEQYLKNETDLLVEH